MNDKRFRVSSNKRLTSILALLAGFVGGLALANGLIGINENASVCLIIAGLVGVVGAVLCLVFVKEYYLQIQEDGFELVKGRKVTKYPFSAFAGSHVTRHYMNGIYYGTSREISITSESGKPIKINANNLSKGRFAELVTYLGQTKYTKSHNMEATAEFFKEAREFHIPNESLIRANKKKLVKYIFLVIALFVLSLGLLIYSLVTHYDSAGMFTAIILAAIFAFVLLFTDVIPAAIVCGKIKNLPDRISLDEYTLTIGEKTFSVGNILNIMMVPASYDIMTREMIIITRNNEKLKYNFGKNEHDEKLTYKDYEKLFSVIELWCIVNKVNFMQILG